MASFRNFLKNKNTSSIVAGAFVLALAVSTVAFTKATTDTTQNTVNASMAAECQPAYNYLVGNIIDNGSVSGVATGTITNNSTSCTYKVGVASYKMYFVETPHGDPDDRWLYTQELHQTVSFDIAPGQTIGPDKLRVALPACRAQVDLFEGVAIVPPVYNTPGHYLMDFEFIDRPVCVKPTPTPTPTPTPAPTSTPSSKKPVLRIEKTVRNITDSTNSNFVEKVEARKDETVEFRIVVKNTGSASATNVRVQDNLPGDLRFVANTIKVDNVSTSGDLFNTGMNIGNLSVNQSKTITFQVRTQSVTTHKTITNVAKAWANNAKEVSDSAQVVIVPVLSTHVELVLSKRAYNDTQKRDASTVTAKAGDVIVYVLKVQNNGTAPAQSYVFEDNIADVLQLANLTAYAGATFDANTNTLIWPGVTIPAGLAIEKTFTVRVKNPVPTGTDYVMTNVYGNEVKVAVERPFVAPKSGAGTTTSIIFALMTVSSFAGYRLFMRREQLV